MSDIEISSLPLNLQALAKRYDKNRNGKIDGNEVFIFQQARMSQQEKLSPQKNKNINIVPKIKNINACPSHQSGIGKNIDTFC